MAVAQAAAKGRPKGQLKADADCSSWSESVASSFFCVSLLTGAAEFPSCQAVSSSSSSPLAAHSIVCVQRAAFHGDDEQNAVNVSSENSHSSVCRPSFAGVYTFIVGRLGRWSQSQVGPRFRASVPVPVEIFVAFFFWLSASAFLEPPRNSAPDGPIRRGGARFSF